MLVLNSCGLTSWSQVVVLEKSLPSLTMLSLAYNDITDGELRTPTHQFPIHQSPSTTDHRPSTIHHQLSPPTTNHPPSINHQPPSTVHPHHSHQSHTPPVEAVLESSVQGRVTEMKKTAAAQLPVPPPPSAAGGGGSGGDGGGKGHDMRGWVSYLDPEQATATAEAKSEAEAEAEAEAGATSADVLFGFAAVSRFTQLRHLDLSRTGLTSWRQVLRFAWMPSLEQLVLTDNQVNHTSSNVPGH